MKLSRYIGNWEQQRAKLLAENKKKMEKFPTVD